VAGGYLVGLPMLVVGLFVLVSQMGVGRSHERARSGRRSARSADRSAAFHAGWSMGTVVGALVGAIAVAAHVPVTAHLAAVAVLVVIVVPRATRHFLAALGPERPVRKPEPPTRPERPTAAASGGLAGAAHPRGGAFVSRSPSPRHRDDWTSIAAIDGYHVPLQSERWSLPLSLPP